MIRGVAQPGRALPSGGRGRKFKSCHPDHFLPRVIITSSRTAIIELCKLIGADLCVLIKL